MFFFLNTQLFFSFDIILIIFLLQIQNKTIGCVDQQPCQNCGRPVLNEGICSRIFLFAGARGEPEVEVEVDVDVEESYEYSSDQDYDEESDTHVL